MSEKRRYMTLSALTVALFTAMQLMAARPAQAATEDVLYNFAGAPDGSEPSGMLTSYNGNLYGMTFQGGEFGGGTVYELSPNGGGWKEFAIYAFCSLPSCADGANPNFSFLIPDGLGNLYGTTKNGGAFGYGTVFELSLGGAHWTEAVLYSFENAGDGANPETGLIMDARGNLYGSLAFGVYELSQSEGVWTEQVIYVTTPTGGYNSYAGLTMDGNGNIFGADYSTVFELSPNGSGGWNTNTLYNFGNNVIPAGTPVLDKAGNLYGTTVYGGRLTCDAPNGCGTVYELIPVKSGKKKGTYKKKVLYSFKGRKKDGFNPVGGIAFDAAGNIYGATPSGGADNDGIVYELVANNGKYKENVLWSFTGTGGENPGASGSYILIPDGAGGFYGATALGGSSNAGVVYQLTP